MRGDLYSAELEEGAICHFGMLGHLVDRRFSIGTVFLEDAVDEFGFGKGGGGARRGFQALQTPRKFHEKPSWGRERENSAKFWAFPSSPHPSIPHASGLPQLMGAPPFGQRPEGPSLYLFLGPYVPHFIIFLIVFCAFFIVSISCHFSEFVTVFVVFWYFCTLFKIFVF